MKLNKLSIIFFAAICFAACSEFESVDENLVDDKVAVSESASKTTTFPIEGYPSWSWDYVNTYAHIYKSSSNFTDEEAEIYAKIFDIVCFEKTHGSNSNVGTDVETEIAAALIKKYNPDCKVLLYKSTNSDYARWWTTDGIFSWSSSDTVWDDNAHYQLYSNDGEALGQFDHRLQEVQDYWRESVAYWCRRGLIDGTFADSYWGYCTDDNSLVSDIGFDSYVELRTGVFDMMDAFREEFGNSKIIIGNGISSRNTTDLDDDYAVDHVAGGMMDHFANYSCADAQSIAVDIDLIVQAAQRGTICVVKGWSRYDMLNTEGYSDVITQDELEATAREDIVFPLACFLMGAGEYSYFCYTWGWDYSNGSMIDYDEFNKPLGEPLGAYTKDGWDYYREFEHAKVWANLETKECEIIWDVDVL